MTPFIELSAAGYIAFAVCMIILTVFAAFILVEVSVRHIGRKYLFCGAVIMAAVLILFQLIDDAFISVSPEIKTAILSYNPIGTLPYAVLAAILLMLAAVEAIFFAAVMRRKKNMLTVSAVKESLDTLPDGVCFFAADGQPLLVNTQMNQISSELFGSKLLNAKRFRQQLSCETAGSGANIIRKSPTVMAETADGRVWDFHDSTMNVGKSTVYELIAYDVTEQYKLSRELKQRNERLNRVNEHLRLFSREMVTFTAEKELLEAKIKVHDSLGQCLLACRAYLFQKGEEHSRNDLLLLWRYVISVMKNEALPSDEWSLLEKSANMLGVSIELTGEFPDNLKQRTAIVTAIRECLTNTASHARGDKLYVNIESTADGVIAQMTNNGAQPNDKVEEKGGLKNLRQIVERAGGIMTIRIAPRFLLQIEFSKGENIFD